MANSIFISYSHHDEVWMRRLTTHLSAIPKIAAVDVWVDTLIGAGENWYDQIAAALDRSRAAVLLISADFLASNFIRREEVPRLLDAEAERGLVIVPVLATPCAFEQNDWIAGRQLRPRGAIALSAKANADAEAALADVAREIASSGTKKTNPLDAQVVDSLAAEPQSPQLKQLAGDATSQYFFYLARDRIQSLFFQLPLETLRRSALDADLAGGAGKTSNAAESQSGPSQITAIVQLPVVLGEIEGRKRVGDLDRVTSQGLQFDFDWYLVSGFFRVKQLDPEAAVVLLTGIVNGYSLTLSCTKSNVIGLVKESGQWIATSATYFLFSGEHELPLKGLIRIIVADRGKQQLMATPLYLTVGALGAPTE